MAYQITNEDWELLTQPGYFIIKQMLRVLDDDLLVLKEIEGVIGNLAISENAESDVRKTTSFTMTPTWKSNIEVNEESLIWINRNLEILVGVLNIRTGEYVWYDQGLYVFTDTSSTYDEITNQLTVNCGDWWVKLDGTKNGQIGALTTTWPAYEEDPKTGEPLEYYTIQEAIVKLVRDFAGIKRYQVDDIGEYKAYPENNEDWEDYRELHDLWNTIPHNLEFSAGATIADMLVELRDLYPNNEMYFDKDIFIAGLIPSNEYDPIEINNDQLQSIFISENASTSLTAIRNVCELWGAVIETDRYIEDGITSKNETYVLSIDKFDKYKLGERIAFAAPIENVFGQRIKVNDLEACEIIDVETDKPVDAGKIKAGDVYVYKYSRIRESGKFIYVFYLLGDQRQLHTMDVLTGIVDEQNPYKGRDGKTYTSYEGLKEYFEKTHACEKVNLTIVPDSPFTIQKIGEILDVKQGSDYEKNVFSESLALSTAVYENWKNCRLTDNITITTKVIPFLKTNIKVEYKPKNQDEAHQYIIKSFSNDYENFTSSITMMRFYPLYIPEE